MPPIARPLRRHKAFSSHLHTRSMHHNSHNPCQPHLSLSPPTPRSPPSTPHAQAAISQRRTAATTRRTTKAQRIAPSATATPGSKYLLSASATAATQLSPPPTTTTTTTTTLVFNPPPSLPTPYQTPPLFLPPSDPRKTLLAQAHAFANPYASNSRAALPPLVRALPAHDQKRYHMTEDDITEMRRLRASDPWEWTVPKLAEKFGCSKVFVGIAAPASKERREWGEALHQRFRDRWGRKKIEAVEARGKRRRLWEMDL